MVAVPTGPRQAGFQDDSAIAPYGEKRRGFPLTFGREGKEMSAGIARFGRPGPAIRFVGSPAAALRPVRKSLQQLGVCTGQSL